MTSLEKLFSLCAIIFLACLLGSLIIVPQMRNLEILLPVSLLGFLINATLLFIVFKDIFTRSFETDTKKYIWILLILIFLPTILIYLPKYGFKPKD